MIKKYALPTLLSLFCLALLLGGGLFFYILTQYEAVPTAASVSAPTQVSEVALILLSEEWAEETYASAEQTDWAVAIAETLADVQALGGNAIALSARLPDGSALFYDATETLTRPEAIAENDGFFANCDGFDTLIAAASAAGIEVLLIPTDADGQALQAGDALPDFATALLEQYPVRLLVQGADGSYQIVSIASDSSSDASSEADSADTSNDTSPTTSEASVIIPTEPDLALIDIASEEAITLALSLQQSEETEALLLGEYSALCDDSSALALFRAYYADGEALPDLTQYLGTDYPRTLAVSYPTEDGSTVSDKSLFIMGTSNPDEPLTIDGETIERYGTEGVWGVLVSLSSGANTFTFENGADSLTYTVTYKYESSWSSSSSGGAYYSVSAGQTIIITDDIASALTNAYSSSTISQTLYEGAVAEIKQYVSYAGSTTPYAYQLITGEWVRAAYAELYDTNRMSLSEAVVSYNTEERASVLTFTGGTPAVYQSWEGNVLTLTLLTADYSGTAPSADWFGCAVSTDSDSNTVLTFTFTDDEPLYGWAVNYDNDTNTTTITLKQQPTLSDDESLPLSGVRVLLDAGHGGTEDLGAMGAAGLDYSNEKDVNLALTMATKYRLEQLGATVILTRDDDTYPTLGDRVTMLNTVHPDFFISIHHNSLELVTDLNTATGVEAYWFFDEGEAFATDLIEAVSEAADRNLRSASYGYYYVTRSNICPATLLEVGFMTNPWEFESISDIDTIWAEAGAIAQTIYNSVAANG